MNDLRVPLRAAAVAFGTSGLLVAAATPSSVQQVLVALGILALGWPMGLALLGLEAAPSHVVPRAPRVLLALSAPLFLALEGGFVPVLSCWLGPPYPGVVTATLASWLAGRVKTTEEEQIEEFDRDRESARCANTRLETVSHG